METTSKEDIRNDIRSANDRFESTFKKGDAEGIARMYTAKGVLLPPGSDLVQGIEAIATFWKGAMDMGMAQVRLTTVDVEKTGDTAIEHGNFTLFGANGQLLDKGKYLVVWKREGDTWKLHKDIWNSSQQAA